VAEKSKIEIDYTDPQADMLDEIRKKSGIYSGQ